MSASDFPGNVPVTDLNDHRENVRDRGIRINDQWRVGFEWPKRLTGPKNVEIVGCRYGLHTESRLYVME